MLLDQVDLLRSSDSLIAAREAYVVLNVYSDAKPPLHTKQWQAANPRQDHQVFDQVCIPYPEIALAHLTARATKGDDSRRVVGFQPASEDGTACGLTSA